MRYLQSFELLSTGSTAETLKTGRLPRCEGVHLVQVGIVPLDAAIANSVVIGIEVDGAEYPLAVLAGSISQNVGKTSLVECLLSDYDRLYARIDAPTAAGERYRLIASGLP